MLLATQGVRVRELSETNKTVANCGFVCRRLCELSMVREMEMFPSIHDTFGVCVSQALSGLRDSFFPFPPTFLFYSFVVRVLRKG